MAVLLLEESRVSARPGWVGELGEAHVSACAGLGGWKLTRTFGTEPILLRGRNERAWIER